jgi:hypothetical protein
MKRSTVEFGTARAVVTVNDNLVYIQVSGLYTDDVAMALLRHLDAVIDEIPDSLIRVWDASGIPADSFQLSSACIDRITEWARQVMARRPGSSAYMVGSTTISYGMARMYEMRADLEPTGVVVLRSLDELPGSIKEKLPK